MLLRCLRGVRADDLFFVGSMETERLCRLGGDADTAWAGGRGASDGAGVGGGGGGITNEVIRCSEGVVSWGGSGGGGGNKSGITSRVWVQGSGIGRLDRGATSKTDISQYSRASTGQSFFRMRSPVS